MALVHGITQIHVHNGDYSMVTFCIGQFQIVTGLYIEKILKHKEKSVSVSTMSAMKPQ